MPGQHLIDRYLPEWDVREIHAVSVPASADRAWRAALEIDLARPRLVRALLLLRSLPARVGHGADHGDLGDWRRRVGLTEMQRAGFVRLGETPGREVVLGLIGPVWALSMTPVPVAPDAFASASVPGTVRIAFAIGVQPRGPHRSLVWTETRVTAADEASRRRFLRYWWFVAPFSSLIRRLVLRSLRASLDPGPPRVATAGHHRSTAARSSRP